jgi:hypothetical protein
MGKWTRRGVLSAGVLGGTGLVIGIAVRPGNPTETAGHLVRVKARVCYISTSKSMSKIVRPLFCLTQRWARAHRQH